MIHGVGPEAHKLHILPDEHARLVDFLAEQKKDLWTAPVVDVVSHLKAQAGS